MAIQLQGNNGTIAEVGGTTFRALHCHEKPLDYGAAGHYRTAVRIASTNAQAGPSRIFEIRNTSDTGILIVPIRLRLGVLQTAVGTPQENRLEVYRSASFTAFDTVNTLTPTSSVIRAATMAPYPGTMSAAGIRYLNPNVAGMSGAIPASDSQPFAVLPYNVSATISTTFTWGYDSFDYVGGLHPYVLSKNQGFFINSQVLNVTSFGVTWFIDFTWAEVPAY